jgi:hypothetical protein
MYRTCVFLYRLIIMALLFISWLEIADPATWLSIAVIFLVVRTELTSMRLTIWSRLVKAVLQWK